MLQKNLFNPMKFGSNDLHWIPIDFLLIEQSFRHDVHSADPNLVFQLSCISRQHLSLSITTTSCSWSTNTNSSLTKMKIDSNVLSSCVGRDGKWRGEFETSKQDSRKTSLFYVNREFLEATEKLFRCRCFLVYLNNSFWVIKLENV